MSRGIQLQKKRAARNSDTFLLLFAIELCGGDHVSSSCWSERIDSTLLFWVHCTSTQLIWGQNDRRPTIASCRRKVLFSTSELFCAACARRVVKVGRWCSHIAPCSSRLVERVWRRKWNDVNTHTHLTPGGIFTSFNFFPSFFPLFNSRSFKFLYFIVLLSLLFFLLTFRYFFLLRSAAVKSRKEEWMAIKKKDW